MTELRGPLERFAEAMEAKLGEHDDDRGSFGWFEETPFWLWKRANEEMGELHRAIGHGDVDGIMEEAVDVANFAMMIHDLASEKKRTSYWPHIPNSERVSGPVVDTQ